jgi:hypothetical protein
MPARNAIPDLEIGAIRWRWRGLSASFPMAQQFVWERDVPQGLARGQGEEADYWRAERQLWEALVISEALVAPFTCGFNHHVPAGRP